MKNKTYWIFALLTISIISIAYGYTKLAVPTHEKPVAMDCAETPNTAEASAFKPTIENKNKPAGKAPKRNGVDSRAVSFQWDQMLKMKAYAV